MIKQGVQNTLSMCATDIMRDKVESVCICYKRSDGKVISIYDMDSSANAFEFVGAVNILAQRIAIGCVDMPELGLDDDED